MYMNRHLRLFFKPAAISVFVELKPISFLMIILISGLMPLFCGSAVQAAGTQLDDVNLHDLPVIDQDGRSLKFKSEIVKDQLAVVIPFYTTCTTAYPILVFTFTRLQKMLGDQLGRDVILIAVSVEPKIDTPSRMKAFARRQKAKAGWTFLSGKRKNLEKILYGIGILPTENLVEHNHNPITIIGGAKTEWRRYHGFPSPELLKSEINKIMEQK